MKYTLVIVDTQICWQEAVNNCSIGIVKEIRKAKEKGLGIIVVVYSLRGNPSGNKLCPIIESEIKGYKNKTITSKTKANGGDKIIKAARRKRFTLANVKVCGVLTDCCIAQTVQHLSENLPVSCIEVVLNACWPQKKRLLYVNMEQVF